MHPNIKTKKPYPEPKPTNGNATAAAKKSKQLATSATFGPTFGDNLDGSTIVTTGLATRKYYRLARTNPEVRLAIRALTQAVFWVKGNVQPQNDYERYPEFREVDEIMLDLINQQLMGLKNFHRFLQDMYTYAMRCGFAVAEKVWEAIDGVWTLTSLSVKRPWDFEPLVDDFGGLEALFYYPTGEYFDPAAFIYAPFPSPGASNWLGEPIMEALLHDTELMQKTEAALAKTTHLLALRTLIHRFDSMRDESEIAAALLAVQQIEEGRMPQFPAMLDDNGKLIHHDELEIMQDRTGTMAMVKLSELATNEATRIKRTIGLPDDLGSTNVSGGAFAKSKTVFDMLMASAADGQEWSAAFVDDQIIADILRFNYPDRPKNYRDPAWVPSEIEEKYSLTRAQFWQVLVNMGVLPATSPIIAQDLGLPLNQITEDDSNTDDDNSNSSASRLPGGSRAHVSGRIINQLKKVGTKVAFWR